MIKKLMSPWEVILLVSAFLSFIYSNVLYFGIGHEVDHSAGIYVGHWVGSILIMLVYLRLIQPK